MSTTKRKEHMSKAKVKSDNLHPLQKSIVLHLAKNGAQTINETVKALSKSYKPTWTAFNSLENKKLIKKTDFKSYRGQEYPRFWLTGEGILMALMEGANAAKLLEQTKTLYPDAGITHCFLQIMPLFSPDVVKMAYSSVKGKGTLEPIDVITLILSGAAIDMDVETGIKISQILRNYPAQYELLKRAVEIMIAQLQRLIADEPEHGSSIAPKAP